METVIHVLRDCRVSRDIWNSLRSDLQDTSFLFLLVREWLKEHMSLKMATGKLCLLERAGVFGQEGVVWSSMRTWMKRKTGDFSEISD